MNKVPDSVRQELSALAARPENEIDYSDVSATTKDAWCVASRGRFYRPVKQQLTVRIDADVLEWLKGQGSGYQSRLNEIPAGCHAGQVASPIAVALPCRSAALAAAATAIRATRD